MLKEIKERRSCRSFDSKMPNEESINEVINAGLYAASARGTQYGIVIAITNKEVREKLVKLNAKVMEKADFDPFYGAPVILLVAVKKWNNSVYDGSCMIENMMIEANELNLGSCYINQLHWLDENPDVREYLLKLGLKEDETICASMAIGFPDTKDGLPIRSERNITGNIVTYIK